MDLLEQSKAIELTYLTSSGVRIMLDSLGY
jgi:hypothetical protein